MNTNSTACAQKHYIAAVGGVRTETEQDFVQGTSLSPREKVEGEVPGRVTLVHSMCYPRGVIKVQIYRIVDTHEQLLPSGIAHTDSYIRGLGAEIAQVLVSYRTMSVLHAALSLSCSGFTVGWYNTNTSRHTIPGGCSRSRGRRSRSGCAHSHIAALDCCPRQAIERTCNMHMRIDGGGRAENQGRQLKRQ